MSPLPSEFLPSARPLLNSGNGPPFYAGLLLLLAAACAHGPKTALGSSAAAQLEARSGSNVMGSASFTVEREQVTLVLSVSGASPGAHAVHLHETPDCTAPDASSAGEHWNPQGESHGAFAGGTFHLGDVGNLMVGSDGTGKLELTTERWSVATGATNDVVGRSIVVHAATDDFKTQPSGNSGDRLACGVVKPRTVGPVSAR